MSDDHIDLTDDELAAMALAATPIDVASEDAVSYWDVVPRHDLGLLPDWYMPTAAAGSRHLRGRKQLIAWALVLTFIAINMVGMCSTYGQVVRAGL